MQKVLGLAFTAVATVLFAFAVLVDVDYTSAKNPPQNFHLYLPATNLAIVEFATSNVGKQVKNGGCAELVESAKEYAESFVSKKSLPMKFIYKQDYVDGKWVRKGLRENIFPGDVFYEQHFEGAKFISAHTGIVLTFGICGTIVTAEANVCGEKKVHLRTIKLTDLDLDPQHCNRIDFQRMVYP